MAEVKTRIYVNPHVRCIGAELFVSQGINDKWGTFYRKASGSLRRACSPMMPMIATEEEAQANLDAYAAKCGLEEVNT